MSSRLTEDARRVALPGCDGRKPSLYIRSVDMISSRTNGKDSGDRTADAVSRITSEQVDKANASGRTPVVFVHGLWLLPSSWDRWVALFDQAGYAPVSPGWPDDPETVEEAKAHPEVFARKSVGQIANHYAEVIGVLPLPISALKAASPVLGNPANRNRAVPLTFEQFRYAFANIVGEDEAKKLYETFAVPGSGETVFQAAAENLNPWTEAKVDTKNPDRGPLLIIEGAADHTVPVAVADAAYQKQKRNPGVTEIVKIPNRGHSLVIDAGWRDVADTALAFVKRFEK